MADWALPALTDAYADMVASLKARDQDAATMSETPTSPPTGFIRWNTSLNKFQRWSGSAWVDLVISAAGGGTGGTSALGTMAFQSASAVAITGGTLAGVAITLGGNLAFDGDGTRSIGTAAAAADKVYIKNALVIPVGVDKWATS